MRRTFVHLAVLALVLMGTGCTFTGSDDSPSSGAGAWFDAVADWDDARRESQTCVDRVGGRDPFFDVFPEVQYKNAFSNASYDFSDVSFTTVSEGDDEAVVRVVGVANPAYGEYAPLHIEHTWYMVREGGKWKWCGWR